MSEYLLISLCCCYALLMLVYRMGFVRAQRIPENTGSSTLPEIRIAVLIPARNEEARITGCLQSVLQQNYPQSLFDVWLLDDNSTDNTRKLAEQMAAPNLHILSVADYPPPTHQAYKKHALGIGISAANGADLIVTTDADCIAGPDWLKTIARCYSQTAAEAIVAPVRYFPEPKAMVLFQMLDFATMQGITAAVNYFRIGAMANGANLAFQKQTFNSVGGYADISHLASGDDFMLLNKIRRQVPEKVVYLKNEEAIISTYAQPDWKSFLNQRIRWASKNGKYPDPQLTAQLVLVYLFNLSLLLSVIAGLAGWMDPKIVIGCWILKIVAEYLLLSPVLRYFRLDRYFFWFLLFQPFHLLYVVMAGFLGFFGKYEWKMRTVQ